MAKKKQKTAKVIKFEDVLQKVAAGKDPDEFLHSQPLYVQKMWHRLLGYRKVLEALQPSRAQIETALATLKEEQREAVQTDCLQMSKPD